MRNLKTIQEWKTNYPNPIVLKKDEIVEIIKKENDNPNWKGWFFCKKQDKIGWVPKQLVNIENNNEGIMLADYSAKELNIEKGEKVTEIKELNGWCWVKRALNNEEGWLPLEILKAIQ